jgi:hypothetical protein
MWRCNGISEADSGWRDLNSAVPNRVSLLSADKMVESAKSLFSFVLERFSDLLQR